MNCPRCDWEMKNTPKDELVQWTCEKQGCKFMATDEWMQKITPEIIAQIKKDVQDMIAFRQKQAADREIQLIERARKKIEASKTVHDVAREYKKISSLADFTKETDKDEM